MNVPGDQTILPPGVDTDTDPETQERDDAMIGTALRWSMAVFVLFATAAGGLAWWLRPGELHTPEEPTGFVAPEIRQPPKVELPRVPFVDITRDAGIAFVHENGAYGAKLLPETMGGGCAFFDFDGDDDPDILFANSQRWPWDPRGTTDQSASATLALYRNDGGRRFTNVTAECGLDLSLFGMGAACGDYDGDGDVDLFVSAVGPNRLFRNDGGHFVDATEETGLAGADDEWSTSCGFLDYDNDGDLDLFVCHYVVWSKERDLGQDFSLVGGLRGYGRPQNFEGTYPSLYRNDGGRFVDVSAEAGIQVRNPATGLPMAKSLGVAFADFNRDGKIDVVVANDTVQNFLFRNLGDGTFEEFGTLCGVAFDLKGQARGAMGIDVAGFRNDNALGIAVGNFANESTALYVGHSGSAKEMPQFTDEAESNGLRRLTLLHLTFGVFFFDCDLDGRLDLLAANGHLEEDIHLVQESQHYAQPPQLLWNCGPEHSSEFESLSVEQCGGDFLRPMVGRGATFADIDGDGDLDVLITASGGPPRLLRNDQSLGYHWLRVKLVGATRNRDAIGAWVELHLPGGDVRRQQVMPTRSYLAQVELPVTFGLGKTDRIEKLVVHWPDGSEQSMADVPIDRQTTIQQMGQ